MSVSHEPEADLDPQEPSDLSGEIERALQRESELRAALVEAHRERLASEDRMSSRVDEALVEAQALRSQLAELGERLARAEEKEAAERVRRERLEALPPVRAIKRVAGAPVLAALRARRTRGFERDLARERGRDS